MSASFKNALKAIRSRRSKGVKLCLRSIAPPSLATESSPPVREKFPLCLILLALSLLEDYNGPSAIQLLKKNQDKVLRAFQKDSADLFKAASAECQNRKAQIHFIRLVRRVFIFAGGLEDVHQLKFDHEGTAIDNLNKLGSLLSITGSSCFRYFDLQAILSALYKSKAITNEYIDNLDVAELISKLMTLLLIGFQSNLGLRTASRSMKVSDITLLGDGVYELQKGYSDRKLVDGDVVRLQLGGVVTGSTTQKLIGDANVCLPLPLEEDRLITLFVDYDGWYDDHQGTQQRLSKEVLRVVQTIKVGQKVLIVEEKENRNLEDEKEDWGKETRIWVVQVLQVLRVGAGHLNFGQNVAFHRTIPGETPKMIKRGVSQRLRNKLEELRVEYSACGLGRIFSSIRCKFLGKRAYVAL
ncbi:hypothetical protein G7Y89_g5381 [Cudoniella acicularis]|uniref:Uncharacterized protein n=1 Tax=Cudoniella acicularis TaxID=354080 RepID=A0A8H4W5S2_9HELO|nr:hypothetical protein G7Y89_g5381 [Cudoniella acicularis]